MKNTNRYIFATIIFLMYFNPASAQDNPSLVQPFLPEIISQFPNVRDLTVSRKEDEIYFTVQSPLGELSSILVSKKQGGKWSAPEVASFSGRYNDLEPFLSPDGLRLFFVSNRPDVVGVTETKDFDIWMTARKDLSSPWTSPGNIGPPVNTEGNEFYPSVAISGNLYFTSDGPLSKGKDDIFFCKWNLENFEAPVSMSDSINSEGYEFNAFIAPDESYLIYTCYNRKDGSGSGDLYISYKSANGIWSAARNLGPEINSAQMDYCPFVNAKSRTLYFTSKRSGVNSAATSTRTIDELKKDVNRYDNGWSRLYQADFNIKE